MQKECIYLIKDKSARQILPMNTVQEMRARGKSQIRKVQSR